MVDSPKNLERSLYNRKTIVHLESVTNEVLAAIGRISSVRNLKTIENKIILEIDDPERDNPEIVRAIVAAGGNIQYVTELRSTLEDVYLKMIREVPGQ